MKRLVAVALAIVLLPLARLAHAQTPPWPGPAIRPDTPRAADAEHRAGREPADLGVARQPDAVVPGLPRLSRPRGSYWIGSKRFTESFVLAEAGVQAVTAGGGAAVHVRGLGGTAIVFRALEEGEIDAYPEYLGTLTEAILHEPGLDLAGARKRLLARGLDVSPSLGFQNGYALAVPRTGQTAALRTLADLAAHPELRLGLSNELLARPDGWPRLRTTYGLTALSPRGLDHGLAYAALEAGTIDVIDVYTTDASLARYDLRLLEDTAQAFPAYDAIWLFRVPTDQTSRRATAALSALRFTREEMVRANDAVERGHVTAERAAEALMAPKGTLARPPVARASFVSGLWDVVRTEGPRHVFLVSISLFFSLLVGVPLGVLAAQRPRIGVLVLGVVSLLQTIPALALLCFLIPVFGIGRTPTIVALFFYGLLPIVRNTTLGFRGIAPSLHDAAHALGLSPWARFFEVELPLALPSLLAGARTAAVLAVGTATVAAFIGAGGFGQPISTGLSLNDTRLILQGALPAAALALLVEGAFGLLERRLRVGRHRPLSGRPS